VSHRLNVNMTTKVIKDDDVKSMNFESEIGLSVILDDSTFRDKQ